MSTEPLSIRPYARLLTMLGEQLLKNERIALVELIKNAYDADADRVDVEFERFGKGMVTSPESRIVVSDNGCGMALDTIRTAWMNPATPSKYVDKLHGKRRTPVRNRVVQGEKGIGRFAVLKLARRVSVVTRPPKAKLETVLAYDFTRFDDDFLTEDGKEKEIFLDEVEIAWSQREAKKMPGRAHGTVIEMDVLKGPWGERLVEAFCRDVANLTDPVSRLTRRAAQDSFEIRVLCNGERRVIAADQEETLKALIENKPVFSVAGRFVSKGCRYVFDKGDGEEEISLYSERVKGLWIWRRRYKTTESRKKAGKKQEYLCGDFAFQFHVFDFSRGIEGLYLLQQTEKNLLKEHRVYLYRDGVRVYPYGDPDDDWLNIDVTRGTGRAGNFFSNDQIIGWVDITQAENRKLRDKTNREGLIETGGAAEDFVFVIQTFLSFLKQGPFLRYQQKQAEKNVAKAVREGLVANHLSALKETLEDAGEKARAREVSKIEAEYRDEKKYLTGRAETTEDLAGVGMSVEMASHDIMLLLGRAQDIGLRLARFAREGSIESVQEQADMLVGVLQQVVSGMRDVQSLFKSSQRRRTLLRVETIVDKIRVIYGNLLEKLEVGYGKSVVGTSPLIARTTDGVVMQVLINLFDNAAYWLDTNRPDAQREIRVTLDSGRGELVFEDSGPGVDLEDRPYIFEPFFSGKGQEGRGLGLYIARQLLERHGYGIELDESASELGGARFILNFVRDDD